MTKREYIDLFEKYLSGKTTTDEEESLFKYHDELNIQDFDNEEEIADQRLIQQRIHNKIKNTLNRPLKKSMPLYWYKVAASALLISSAGWFFLNKKSTNVNNKHVVQIAKVKPIVPGGNKAVLTLANGAQVDLDSAANGFIATNGNVSINKAKNGQLVYAPGTGRDEVDSKALFNTISTPRGGQYQVVLPDGTSVWLNAKSTLKYPVKFIGSERRIELNGEAYFEVAKNKSMPFIVHAGNTDVKVLGTHFNVMAYPDEASIKTTLLEGSVILNAYQDRALLVPGQQGEVGHTYQKINVTYVNTDDAVAWKNGYFSFKNENIVSIMRKVSRWYDVDISYKDDLSQVVFGGTISRAKDINELLKKIEITGSVHFKIEGRSVIVKL